uniref:Secreted protein n=1 Tax=Thraustotheca clavata TaxID=74557 RepID=A0A0A7CM16_9STRA|nr:secreted protein [Thraustotheca clavata]
MLSLIVASLLLPAIGGAIEWARNTLLTNDANGSTGKPASTTNPSCDSDCFEPNNNLPTENKITRDSIAYEVFDDIAIEAVSLLTDMIDGVSLTNLVQTSFSRDMENLILDIENNPKTIVNYLDYISATLTILTKSLPWTWSAYSDMLQFKLDAITHRVQAASAVVDYHNLVRGLCHLTVACQRFGLHEKQVNDIVFGLRIHRDLVLEAPCQLPRRIGIMRTVMDVLALYQSDLKKCNRWDEVENCMSAYETLKQKIDCLVFMNI